MWTFLLFFVSALFFFFLLFLLIYLMADETARICHSKLNELDEKLRMLRVEAHSAPIAHRSMLQLRIEKLAQTLRDQRQSLKHIEARRPTIAEDSDDILPDGGGGGSSSTDPQRQVLLDDTMRLHTASERLTESHRMAIQTEMIGASVLGNLRRQGEQLQSAHGRLQETESYLDRSTRIVRGMTHRMRMNKWALYIILFLLIILAIGYIMARLI